MKKLFALALSCVMALSMTTMAFAADAKVVDRNSAENKTTNEAVITNGTISISGIHTDNDGNVDTKYDVYKCCIWKATLPAAPVWKMHTPT